MKATLKFKTNKQANSFALAYSRNTLSGHIVAGKEVTVYDLDDDQIDFINEYMNDLNK